MMLPQWQYNPDGKDEVDTTHLEKTWHARITSTAACAVRKDAAGIEERHDAATEAVEALLFDSLDWEHVPATEISDIAYEAATIAVRRIKS